MAMVKPTDKKQLLQSLAPGQKDFFSYSIFISHFFSFSPFQWWRIGKTPNTEFLYIFFYRKHLNTHFCDQLFNTEKYCYTRVCTETNAHIYSHIKMCFRWCIQNAYVANHLKGHFDRCLQHSKCMYMSLRKDVFVFWKCCITQARL